MRVDMRTGGHVDGHEGGILGQNPHKQYPPGQNPPTKPPAVKTPWSKPP